MGVTVNDVNDNANENLEHAIAQTKSNKHTCQRSTPLKQML